MSSRWEPDDSFIDKDDGELKGVRRAEQALEKHGVRIGGVVTSKDPGVAEAARELTRTHLPPGFRQWQLPLGLGPNKDSVAFFTEAEAGAKVPIHAHKCDLLRIVISGSVRANGIDLGPGDWMYVFAGEDYDLESGPGGCIIWHIYW